MMNCGYQSRCGGSSRLVCILVKYLVRGRRAGSKYLRTISRSVTRDIIDVTDIGRSKMREISGWSLLWY